MTNKDLDQLGRISERAGERRAVMFCTADQPPLASERLLCVGNNWPNG